MSETIVPCLLVVARRSLESDLGGTVLWRRNLERLETGNIDEAVAIAGTRSVNLVVVDLPTGEVRDLIVALRGNESSRSCAIAVLSRGMSAETEAVLLVEGANVIVPTPVNPMLWTTRLEELLEVPARRIARIPVGISTWNFVGSGQVAVSGVAVNVSMGGMLLEADPEIDVGTKVDLRFHLPDDPVICEILGEVVRIDPSAGNRCGVQFVVMRGQARSRIARFLRIPIESSEATDEGEAGEWEVELRASETREQALLDCAFDAIITVDHAGRILEFNAAAEEMFGVERRRVIGTAAIETLLPAEDRDVARGHLRAYVESGPEAGSHAGVKFRARRADGSVFPAELSLTPMLLRGRIHITGFVRDVREKLALKRTREELLATINHELRTPLTALHGSLALMAGGGFPADEMEPMIRLAYRNSRRLVQLVENASDLEDVASGRFRLQISDTDMVYLIRRALARCRLFARELGVVVRLVEVEFDTALRCDSDRVVQVLDNLVTNAIKHSGNSENVEIEVERREGELEVHVVDHGVGLPAGREEKIFDAFTLADGTDQRTRYGAGLGLAICRSVIDLHGGRILAVATPGGGATFRFILPLA